MNQTPVRFPEDVRFNPLVGLKSFRIAEAGGAWRLIVLAKNLDETGLGKVERRRLRAYSKHLGISTKQFNRWLSAARYYDMVQDVQSESGEWMLILASNSTIAKTLGCKARYRVVSLPAKYFVSKGWRAYVFATWQSVFTNNGERLVSQKKQAELTGISEQTQRQFNKQAGVQSRKNYAVSNIHANGYSAVLEFGNRAGLFEYWDKEKHQKYLGWRIPNSRYFPMFGLDGSIKTRRALSLFNRTAEQYSASMKSVRKSENTKRKFPEIYLFDRTSRNGNDLWIHLPF